MKVALLQPPRIHQVWAGVPQVFSDRHAYLFPPLGIMQISGYLKKQTHHDVDVWDAHAGGWSFEEIGRKAKQENPDVIGITTGATHNLVNVTLSIEQIKRHSPDTRVIIGGPHVTSFPEEALLPGVDAAIQGDGESALVHWLEAVETGAPWDTVPNLIHRSPTGSVVLNPQLSQVEDLDSIPFPDRDACPPGRYYTPGMKGARTTTMISSRGCPFRCVFCNVPHGYRARSPESIVDEMEICVRKHGVEDIHFVDDIFNINAERVMAIAEEIIRRRLKIWWGYKATVRQTTPEMIRLARRAGCYRMHYGVETFTDDGLKALNKKATVREIKNIFRATQEAGSKAIAYMIIGNPHEKTAEEVLAVREFMRELSPDYVVYSLFTPYPDAPIFQEGAEKGLYDADCWKRFMRNPTIDHGLPTAWEEHLSKEDLLRLFKKVNRGYYFHPPVFLRTMRSISSWAELKRIALGGVSLMRMERLKPDGGLI